MNQSKSLTIDPICGMTVDKETALKTERDGVISYFCSSHCQTKFQALPVGAKPEAKSGGCCG